MNRSYIAALTLSLLFTSHSLASGKQNSFPGSISILNGCSRTITAGLDSETGRITCPSGLQMNYDIGEMAGVYTEPNPLLSWTKGEVWRKNLVTNQQTAVAVFTKDRMLLVSFPDSHANFYSKVANEEQMTEMLLMVSSYRPESKRVAK